MARPIEATPILYGEDARRFLRRMKEKRTESQVQRERRLLDYEDCLEMLRYGEELRAQEEKLRCKLGVMKNSDDRLR